MATILIVEDDHNLGLMLKDILGFNDYKVIVSKKPLETLRNLNLNTVDLVLLDKLISGIDGTSICIQIRNNKATENMPILMMSALHAVDQACMEAGASDFIAKPFEMDIFLRKIEKLLAKSQPTANTTNLN